MHLLNYNQFVETMHCCEARSLGGNFSVRDAPDVSTSDEETILRKGFNTHSFKLPNGCVIEVYETGELFLSEQSGSAKKIRDKDTVQQHLIS